MNPPDHPSSPETPPPPLTFGQRFLLVWAWWLRGLFDGQFASQLRQAQLEFDQGPDRPALPTGRERPSLPAPAERAPEAPADLAAARAEARRAAAFGLLRLLQREGRFIDFVQQDITSFSDADIGAAARLVHAGCRKVLEEHIPIQPVVDGPEGAPLRLETGYDPAAYKLTGQVSGNAPYSGVLRHKGWKARALELPEPVSGNDGSVLMPAEVEI